MLLRRGTWDGLALSELRASCKALVFDVLAVLAKNDEPHRRLCVNPLHNVGSRYLFCEPTAKTG